VEGIMMGLVGRSARRVAAVGVLFAAAGGIAFAAIPDGAGVYTACMLNKVGTIRLIDPTLPADNPMSHCTSLETRITFNQQGQRGLQGLPGAAGKDGTNGTDGTSPTVSQLAVGDAHCGGGGASIADAQGNTAYVCNGTNGTNGEPFSGTFTSPNGQFSISVADSGITLAGPSGTSMKLQSDGSVSVNAPASLDVRAGTSAILQAGTSLDLKGAASATLESADPLNLKGSIITQN
jgi:hypothetical protein